MEKRSSSESKLAEVVRSVYEKVKGLGADYVVLNGCTGQLRESVARSLRSLVDFPVYTETQFPNSERKVDVDLALYF